jgi:lysophospholipase L1-like esterase
MQRRIVRQIASSAVLALFVSITSIAIPAQPWTSLDNNTRYLALGDSLSAGYAALPVTQGFVFRLYQSGTIDNIGNLHFCAAAVPGAKSADVLQYQIPQVPLFFKNTGKTYRKVVTLTVGGNDLFSVIGPTGAIDSAGIPGMLASYGNNLAATLANLTEAPDVRVYVGNLYDPRLPIPNSDLLILAMNQITANVASSFPEKVKLVDLYAEFQGKKGLLLNERQGAAPDEVHPTNAGYGVIAAAFKDAILKNTP